jgi:uncharacterized protein (TIGR02246 family)
MKTHTRICFIVAGVLALTGCGASSGTITATDRSAIEKTVQAFPAAILKGDFAAAAALWTADGWILPPHAAAVRGRADIAKFFAGFGKTSALTEHVVESDGRGDVAYAWFRFDATFVPPGATASVNDKGKGLLAMVRQSDGSWLVSRAAWNSDLPLPK